jgi:methionyl-tRNA formyltransferase
MLVNRSERLLNILLLGSDHFSIGTLQAVLKATRLWESIHVVTAGEKDVGRGKNGKRKVARKFAFDEAR